MVYVLQHNNHAEFQYCLPEHTHRHNIKRLKYST